MKKLLIYLVVIIFCLPNIFILYKTFNVLDNLDSLPKKTGWVKGYEYWGMGKKCHVLKLVYSYFVSLSDIYLFKKLSL